MELSRGNVFHLGRVEIGTNENKRRSALLFFLSPPEVSFARYIVRFGRSIRRLKVYRMNLVKSCESY